MEDFKLMFFNNKKWLIIPIILIIVGFLGFYTYSYTMSDDEKSEFEFNYNEEVVVYTQSEIKEEVLKPSFISVDIKGRVKKPGVYQIDDSLDRRINDVIVMAGGLLSDADTSITNLSKKLFDEMVIIIYSKDEVKNMIKIKEEEEIKNDVCINECDSCIEKDDLLDDKKEESNNSSNNNLVNINLASKETLMTLPGIGESKAVAIIEYRKNNNFKSIEEIMNVSGIGESVYNQIKEYITI